MEPATVLAECAADPTKRFFDTSFYGDKAVYWRNFIHYDYKADMTAFMELLDAGTVYWDRWAS